MNKVLSLKELGWWEGGRGHFLPADPIMVHIWMNLVVLSKLYIFVSLKWALF